MVFNATFNNISVIMWRSVFLMEETGVPRKNHRSTERHRQTLSHNVVSSTTRSRARFEFTTLALIETDYLGGCISNCHTITKAKTIGT